MSMQHDSPLDSRLGKGEGMGVRVGMGEEGKGGGGGEQEELGVGRRKKWLPTVFSSRMVCVVMFQYTKPWDGLVGGG